MVIKHNSHISIRSQPPGLVTNPNPPPGVLLSASCELPWLKVSQLDAAPALHQGQLAEALLHEIGTSDGLPAIGPSRVGTNPGGIQTAGNPPGENDFFSWKLAVFWWQAMCEQPQTAGGIADMCEYLGKGS